MTERELRFHHLANSSLLDEPQEISWGPSGISYTTLRDPSYVLSKPQEHEALVRGRVENAVRPAITVQQLAKLTGLKPSMIYGFVEGHRAATPKTLRTLARALDKAGL